MNSVADNRQSDNPNTASPSDDYLIGQATKAFRLAWNTLRVEPEALEAAVKELCNARPQHVMYAWAQGRIEACVKAMRLDLQEAIDAAVCTVSLSPDGSQTVREPASDGRPPAAA